MGYLIASPEIRRRRMMDKEEREKGKQQQSWLSSQSQRPNQSDRTDRLTTGSKPSAGKNLTCLMDLPHSFLIKVHHCLL